MDRKGILILVVCFALLVAWPALVRQIWPEAAQPAITEQQGTNTTSRSTGTGTNEIREASTTTGNSTPTKETPAANSRGTEKLVSLSNDVAEYVFTSHGGGIRTVNLSKYAADSCTDHGNLQPASINTNAPAPIMALSATSAGVFNKGNPYELSIEGDTVTATATLANGLLVKKTFTLSGTNYLLDTSIKISNPTLTPIKVPAHEVITGTSTSVNPKEDPLFKGVTWQEGSKVQKREGRWFENRTLGCFPGTPHYQATPKEALEQISWMAAYNQFFAVAAVPQALENTYRIISISEPRHQSITHPDSNLAPTFNAWLVGRNDFNDLSRLVSKLAAPADTFTQYIVDNLSESTRTGLQASGGTADEALTETLLAEINGVLLKRNLLEDNGYFFDSALVSGEIRELRDTLVYPEDRVRLNRVLLQKAWPNEMIPANRSYQASFLHEPQDLQPGQALTYTYTLYTGPKEYKTFASLSERLDNKIDEVMGFGGFFGFFSKILLLSMNGLHGFGIPYGWTIVVITIIIKMVFWPLTQSSTRSMKRMAKIQPEMQALRAKYQDDPQKLNVEMMRVMRENKVNPLGGCLPMLIQMPIFLGFFFMIKSAIELRGASFLWACDLSVSDTIFTVPGLGWIPFLGVPGEGLPINPMPILMCVTMLYQMRLTPTSPTMDPMQQKIMKFMPMMFILFLYRYSSGLTLYWTVNNVLSIIQTKLIRKDDDDDKGGSTGDKKSPGGGGPAPKQNKPQRDLPPVPGSPEEKSKRKRVKGMPKR